MANFQVPTRDQVSEGNKAIFDQLEKGLGFVPNIYAALGKSDTALGNVLGFANGKTSLKAKEKEVIDLVVSQYNGCSYCLAAHTAISKMNGFTEEQIIELRTGRASFDARLDALAQFVQSAVSNRSKPSSEATGALLEAGFTEANLVDVIAQIGVITITNFLHGTTGVPVDFPAAPALEAVAV